MEENRETLRAFIESLNWRQETIDKFYQVSGIQNTNELLCLSRVKLEWLADQCHMNDDERGRLFRKLTSQSSVPTTAKRECNGQFGSPIIFGSPIPLTETYFVAYEYDNPHLRHT